MTSYSEVPLRIAIADLSKVRPTEETLAARVEALFLEILACGYWTHPVLVDETSYAVMDGHHRLAAAERLGLRSVPAILLSYADPRVRLEAWRPDESFTPEVLRERALSGRLLPYKTTRHIIQASMPRCRVPLSDLVRGRRHGETVDSATLHPSRSALLTPYYHYLGSRLGIRTIAGTNIDTESPETLAPHPLLRRMLQNDPAMAALIPAAHGRIAVGRAEDAPFYLKRSGLLRVSPALLDEPAAIGVAARWGLEASFLQSIGAIGNAQLQAILRHGIRLLQNLPLAMREIVLDRVPREIAVELLSGRTGRPSDSLLRWQASCIEALQPILQVEHAITCRTAVAESELNLPVEQILTAGGDSRLIIDRTTGLNRYGVAPRPRPEAIHFSSSTASSISDYGFMFADTLRRDLLAAGLCDGTGSAELRNRLVDTLGGEIMGLLGLAPEEDDICIAPSGTDTELLAVMLALAAGQELLTNVLISPEETGRGVVLAGAGRFFDDIAASGEPVQKGASAWPEADIEVIRIDIRAPTGSPRSVEDVDADVEKCVLAALNHGRHVLLHVLRASKTGLNAPSLDLLLRLDDRHNSHLDVVVDACQFRTPPRTLGECVRRGWLIQISGSKFLTGPPFSGG
jgi:hypothetical protein